HVGGGAYGEVELMVDLDGQNVM
ncbi:hypothetical protein A2U01_0101562, partial [Trifolium medium]|nr:hypothetical protein [Trifolium medium]